MNIKSGAGSPLDARKMMDAASRVPTSADPLKDATVAQSTAKAVHEALAKAGAASTVAPSAQLAVDSGKISRLSGVDKTKDSEKLDTAKLDAIKARIESGAFEFDYQAIAMSLVEQSVQRRGAASR